MAFMRYYEQLMQLLEANEDLNRTARGIGKQILWAAVGVTTGGVFLGPIGGFAGGLAGLAVGYFTSVDYQAMLVVLRNMPDERKEELVQQVQNLVGNIAEDALIAFVANQAQRQLLLQLALNFSRNV